MVLTPVAELNSCIEPAQRLNAPEKQPEHSYFHSGQQRCLLQAVIEGFVDGVLILTDRGEWVYANTQAFRICHQLSQGALQPNVVVQEIWRVCQSSSESCKLFPTKRVIIESEVTIDSSVTYRIRARWLDLAHSDASGESCPLLLVTLEDRYQSNENRAIADVRKYGLTSREAEVWVLRRAKYSYKEIATKLHITINTVKRHMKNIYAKQQTILCAEH
jgi:DNA-binding CsgD family transcriptional regulator